MDNVLKALEAGEHSRTDFDTLPDETRQSIMDAVTKDSAAVFAVVIRTLIELGPDEKMRDTNQEGERRYFRAELELLNHLASRLEEIGGE